MSVSQLLQTALKWCLVLPLFVIFLQIFAVLSQTVPGVRVAFFSSSREKWKEVKWMAAFWKDTQTYLKWKDTHSTSSTELRQDLLAAGSWPRGVRNEQCPSCTQSCRDRRGGECKRGYSQWLWKKKYNNAKIALGGENRSRGIQALAHLPPFLQNVCGKAGGCTLISIKHLLHWCFSSNWPIIQQL